MSRMDARMESSFLALVLSLPSQNATERMRAWRTLKGYGAAVLRDGVYLLPDTKTYQERLSDLAVGVRASGGQAEVLRVTPLTTIQEAGFRTLFDRSKEYARLGAELDKLDPNFPDTNHLKKTLRTLRRRFSDVSDIDFFPGQAQQEVETRLLTLERELNTRLFPGEPRTRSGTVESLDIKAFQGCLWATRRNLGVDRLTSAWLIRRFIDPQARFVWFTSPGELPPEAIGFDFDGARFFHMGVRVTFETLLASFGLEDNHALSRLARLVHDLDMGEEKGSIGEAPGFLALLKGMKTRIQDDDRLLEEGARILDDYHLFFSNQEKNP